MADSLVELQRSARDVVAVPADDNVVPRVSGLEPARTLSVLGCNARSPSPFENRMNGNDPALVENADHVRELLHLDDAARAVGNAVVVAADRDEPIVADPALELQEGIERRRRQWLKFALLGGERGRDDLLRRAVHAHVGDGRQPIVELDIEVVEIAEAARKEEVLPDIAERPLEFSMPTIREYSPPSDRFEAEPWHTGSELLARLQAEYPGAYPDRLLRTLQRRLKSWRSEQANALLFGAADLRHRDATTMQTTPAEAGRCATPTNSTTGLLLLSALGAK